MLLVQVQVERVQERVLVLLVSFLVQAVQVSLALESMAHLELFKPQVVVRLQQYLTEHHQTGL